LSDPQLQELVEQAIWGQNPGRLMDLPQADPATWAGAAQYDLHSFGMKSLLTYPTKRAAPHPEICVVMMVKDEEDILGHNLAWLHFVGIRRFIVSDNGSTDDTSHVIRSFKYQHSDTTVIVIDDPLVSYIQSLKTTGMLRFAISIWPDLRWVFPVDADEFLIPAKGFGVLNELTHAVGALAIPKVIHFRNRQDNQLDNETPLSLMTLRSPPFCVPPKSACRAKLDFTIAGGNHKIYKLGGDMPPYHPALTLGIYYREFQTRSFEHLLKRIENGGRAILAARMEGREEGGHHWLNLYETLQSEGEEGLRQHYERDFLRGDDPNYVIDPFYGCPIE
jgi:glycosyltransferase involved in cell wall biosynthesis